MEQMEQKNTCGCNCTMCHIGHHRMWRWVMIVVGIIIAFTAGVKLGEIKGYLMSGGEYGGRPHGWMMQNPRDGYILRYQIDGPQALPDSSSAQLTTPATKK